MDRADRARMWLLMISSLRFIAMLLLAAVLTACSTHVPRKDLPGAYVATYPFGTGVLVLHRNGTFTQTAVVFADPHPKIVTGVWRAEDLDGTLRLELHNILYLSDGSGYLNTHWRSVPSQSSYWDGFWPPECHFFRVILDADTEYYYVKQGGFSCPILGVLPHW